VGSREDDSHRAVGQGDEHTAVRNASCIEVLLLDAQGDDHAVPLALCVDRPQRGEVRAVRAPQLPETLGDGRRFAHPLSPSRSMRPFESARSAWCAITRTHWISEAKRGSLVAPSTYRL